VSREEGLKTQKTISIRSVITTIRNHTTRKGAATETVIYDL